MSILAFKLNGKGLTHMYVLQRVVNGATETLKGSNSYVTKTFIDFSAASNLAKRLNSFTKEEMHWSVSELKGK